MSMSTSMSSLAHRIKLHKDFWDGTGMTEPLVSYRIGDCFFANKFKANLPLLKQGKLVTPEMVDVDGHLEDYERMFRESEATGQTAFFTADPCTGYPWMEAMLGCSVHGAEVSFVSGKKYSEIGEVPDLVVDEENPWYRKYMEFLVKLAELSAGRFPVGQPIMRGVTDIVGALAGQEEMAYSLVVEQDQVRKAFNDSAKSLKKVIEDQYKIVKPFHGGYAAGFYHLWAPGPIIWYQEDLSALMSPRHFDEYLRDTSAYICEGYNYTFVHVHPSSFFHLDGMLSLESLRAVQINKEEIGVPSVSDMLPQFEKVFNAGKALILFGRLDEQDIDLLREKFPQSRLFLNIVTPTVESAQKLNKYITG